MPFAATWMDLEIMILSEVLKEKQMPYDITYMWNLKNVYKMNLFTKIGKDSKFVSQSLTHKLMVTKGEK